MRRHDKHVLVCTGQRCTPEGKAADALFKQLGQAIDACEGLRVKRTRSHCFAVCKNGPIMVVYPEGVWYQQVDEAALQRIVQEHLCDGQPVEPLIFHRVGEGDITPGAPS